LKAYPGLQYAVLINPLVYASEVLRGSLLPASAKIEHMPLMAVIAALVLFNVLFLVLGLKKFGQKAVS
jgi:ABC-2 type transport system permease protein